jgi:hypothetical protein
MTDRLMRDPISAEIDAYVRPTGRFFTGNGKRAKPSNGIPLNQRRKEQQALMLAAATTIAPVRANTTPYVATDMFALPTGEIVRVTGGGTSSGAAPTITPGSVPAAIVDGGVTYWATGDMTKPVPAGVPVVTVSDQAGNSALTLYNTWSDATLFDQPATPTANIQIVGGDTGKTTRNVAWSYLDGSTNANGFVAVGQTGPIRTLDTRTNADVIEIGYFSGAADSLNLRLKVWVQGYGVTEVPIVPAAVGSSRFIRLSIPGGRVWRRVSVMAGGVFNFRYLGIPAGCALEKPQFRLPFMGWFGDSWVNTESPSVNMAIEDASVRAANRLGFPHILPAALGGTSWTLGSGGRLSFVDLIELNDFSTFGFDAVTISHGYNAAESGVAPATEAAGLQLGMSKVRGWNEEDPTIPIFIINDWYAKAAFATQHAAMSAALKAAFLEVGDPYSFMISPQDGSVICGDGTVIVPVTTAWIPTAAVAWVIGADASHPSPAGVYYIGDRIIASQEACFEYMASR